jgi:hypothetical protein
LRLVKREAEATAEAVPAVKYRGRVLTGPEVAFIRELIARNPGASRWKLSRLLCQAWGWAQPNGAPCDILSRGLLLALHRAGHIQLPPPRRKGVLNNLIRRVRPAPVLVDTMPLECALAELQPLEFVQVRRRSWEPVFDGLIEQYHYLGYTRPVGEHLKYLVLQARTARPVACLAFSSAPRHLGPRDRFIGWSMEARRKNLRLVAYNPRYLIVPWVKVPHLASHVLSRMARMLPREWQCVYGHPVHFLETFVDPGRFRGTCYRAANWVFLGGTTGRGKDDLTHRPNRPIKDVWGYPLHKRFRELLGAT